VQVPLTLFGLDGRYAAALFTAASKKQALEQVERDLLRIKAQTEKQPRMLQALSNPTLTRAQKKALTTSLLKPEAGGSVSNLVSNLVDVLQENGRLGETLKVADAFLSLMAAKRGELAVLVTSAKPLDASVLASIKKVLLESSAATQYKSFTLRNAIKPSVLGGFVVEFGGKTLDLSVSSRVSKLNRLLAEPL